MSNVPLRPSRNRKRRGVERPPTVVALGLLVFAVAALLGYIAVRAPKGEPWRNYETIYAEVPDPGNLQKRNEVRIAGVTVGQVVQITAHRGRGRMELQIDPGVDPLPTDTRVYVRGKGLLGARYVQLVPGKSGHTLKWGSTIEGGKDALTYGVPDVVDTFDRQTRGALGEMAGQFGTGLLGRGGELNRALDIAPNGASDFRATAHAILARDGAAARLIPSLDVGFKPLDASREPLARLQDPAARALQPFVDRRAATRDALQEAPQTLSAMRSGEQTGIRLLRSVRTLSAAVTDTLPAAPPGLRAAIGLLRTSHTPLRRTAMLLSQLRPTVPAVLRITRRLQPNLVPLRRLFADLRQLVVPLVPYNCDIENGAENLRSVIGYAEGPGGLAGPLSAFRATVMPEGTEVAGPFYGSFGPLESGVSVPYPPPCRYSPGRRYDVNTGLPVGLRGVSILKAKARSR